jgi:N-acylglucosamine 2-epimerase
MSSFDFCATAKRYKNELMESVVPFWEKFCVDTRFGGYNTMLDRDGSVYDTEKFMWMQWRIVYMFANLAESDLPTQEQRAKWIEIAEGGFDFLTENGCDENGNYYFALNQAGEPAVAPYNIFSECFAAMGAAALFKATGLEKHRAEAMRCMENYLARMDDPKGRWNKELAGRPGRLAFGQYMILANLAEEIDSNLGTEKYKEDVKRAADVVLSKFWNEKSKLLFEFVNKDGSFDLDTSLGRHVIPGHGLEALWFLSRHAENEEDSKVISQCADYMKSILEFGWDEKHGGLFYFMDAQRKPHFELHADMKLWWVHNEAIIATLYGYKLTGDPELLEWFQRVDEWTWARFPDSQYGEWFGYLNRSGEPANMLKGGRWKTFFHLPRCLKISHDLLTNLSQS